MLEDITPSPTKNWKQLKTC